MPCGRKIIMSTRMMPKIIRSYFAGSNWVGKSARLNPRIVTPAFFNSLSQSEKPLRTWRFSTVTAMAPRTAPGIDPMPPRITIERTPIDSRKVNDSGLMKSCLAEKTTPMTPANDAPHAKARSFARPTRDVELAVRADVVEPDLTALLDGNQESFQRRFGHTPFERPGVTGMRRNATAVLANRRRAHS